MEHTSIPQGIEIVQKAIEADGEGDYEKALDLYRDALERFTVGLQYEKNAARKKIILERTTGYMARVEELADYVKKQNELDKNGGARRTSAMNSGLDRSTLRITSTQTMWNTRLTRQTSYACRVPIVGAPMAGHAGGALAAAVCRAGGLGLIGCGHWLASSSQSNGKSDNAHNGLEQLEKEVQIFRRLELKHGEKLDSDTTLSYPLGLGFIGYSTFATEAGWDRFRTVLTTYQPNVVQFFAPAISHHAATGQSNVALAQAHGAKVLAQVGTVHDAIEAVQAGVDGLILQGSEAGGHGLRREQGNGTLSLAAAVLHQLRTDNDTHSSLIILAAGGIANGPTMAAALALGCDGVVVGTRLCASLESLSRLYVQQRLVEATSCDAVVRTHVFDAIQNTYTDHPWPIPYDSVGAIRNDTSQQWKETCSHTELASALDESYLAAYRQAQVDGDADIYGVLAGEGVGLFSTVEPAHEIVSEMSHAAASILRNLPRLILSD